MTALVPNGKQQFCDSAGVPLALGSVYFYVPGTTTLKDTWQDNGQAAKNANPVPLDAAGRAAIYGVGDYRQIVQDKNGNTIWDQVSSAPPAVADLNAATTGIATLNGQVAGLTATQTTQASLIASNTSSIAILKSAASTGGTLYYPTYAALVAAFAAYNAATAYAKGATLVDQGIAWVNIVASTGVAPPTLPATSNASWQVFRNPLIGQAFTVPTTDTGTHTDPAVGGTVNNTGIFAWATGTAGTGAQYLFANDAALSKTYSDAAAASATAAASSAAAIGIPNRSYATYAAFVAAPPTGRATVLLDSDSRYNNATTDNYFDGTAMRTPPIAIFNSTIPFALANTGIAALGAFPATSGGGHNYTTPAFYSRVETMAVGSKCEAQLYSFGTTTFTVTVDGTPTTITPPSGWSWQTLYTGLSDAPHRVRLEGGTQWTFDTDALFRVTGIAPAVTRPTDLPAFYILGSTPYSTYGAVDGCKDLNTNIYPTPYQRTWSTGGGWGLRFKATTTTIRLWIYNSGTSTGALAVLQDGTQIATLTPSGTSGAYDVATVATGLSGSHEYEIKNITGGKVNYIYALLVDSLDTVTHAAKNIEANYGDSIAAEIVNATVAADTRLGDAYKVSLANGTVSVLCGTGGAQVSTALRDGTAVISSIPLGSASVSRVWVVAGTNDMYAASAQTGGTLSATIAAFQADYQTMLANIRTAAPSAKIYAQGIYDTTRTPGNIAAFRSAISAAVAARVTAGDANVVYRDMAGVINPATDTDDGLHPNAAGYAKLATYKLANL